MALGGGNFTTKYCQEATLILLAHRTMLMFLEKEA